MAQNGPLYLWFSYQPLQKRIYTNSAHVGVSAHVVIKRLRAQSVCRTARQATPAQWLRAQRQSPGGCGALQLQTLRAPMW